MNRMQRFQRVFCYACALAVLTLLVPSCGTLRHSRGETSAHHPQAIFNMMRKVADWQVDSIRHKGWRHPERDWTNGALYTGLLAFGNIANDSSWYHFMRTVGVSGDWQIVQGRGRYFADNYCVGQLYCRMYEIYHEPAMIADLRTLADTLIARPHTESLEWKDHINLREWAWCDGLYMGPPSLAMLAKATGDIKYMDLVDSLWWKTTAYLYDKTEHLYYRDSRYFNQREKNGKKVFWSRGNGWVMGGLVRVLQNMPSDYHDRSRWVALFKDMAAKIASLQQPDGTWHASLLDPASYPVKETSGSGFFCYALAWGINHHLLDREKYAPVVWKAWDALVSCVHPDGMLGYVQAIGAEPKDVSYDDTEVYAVGAFLLAGDQVVRMAMENKAFSPDVVLHHTGATAETLGAVLAGSHRAHKPGSRYRNMLSGQIMRETTDVAQATTLYLQKVK
jgi:rhamnogalacturonyl hydrolase YesR